MNPLLDIHSRLTGSKRTFQFEGEEQFNSNLKIEENKLKTQNEERDILFTIVGDCAGV